MNDHVVMEKHARTPRIGRVIFLSAIRAIPTRNPRRKPIARLIIRDERERAHAAMMAHQYAAWKALAY